MLSILLEVVLSIVLEVVVEMDVSLEVTLGIDVLGRSLVSIFNAFCNSNELLLGSRLHSFVELGRLCGVCSLCLFDPIWCQPA